MTDKVIVIGGSGFMGSHTADELSRQGYQVAIFDCLESPWLRDDQQMIVGDMLDREQVREVVGGARYVYHFAGIADIGEAVEKPYETVQLNVMGILNALDACVHEGVERFVYASTMYVYSTKGSFYRASKQASEQMIEAYCEKFDLDFTFLRYGSLYGPRAQEWNGLRSYVQQILRDGAIHYHGTGRERREYIHAYDAARLSVQILDGEHSNQAITVTGQQVLTSGELLAMIFEIAGVPENIHMSATDLNNDHYIMTPYQYSPRKAKKLVPDEFMDLGQGILDMVEDIGRGG